MQLKYYVLVQQPLEFSAQSKGKINKIEWIRGKNLKRQHIIKVNTASIFLVVAGVMDFGNEYY